jgi:hypothetical protein
MGGPNFSVQSRCLDTDAEETGLVVITVSGDMTDLEFTLYMNSVDKSRWVILADSQLKVARRYTWSLHHVWPCICQTDDSPSTADVVFMNFDTGRIFKKKGAP